MRRVLGIVGALASVGLSAAGLGGSPVVVDALPPLVVDLPPRNGGRNSKGRDEGWVVRSAGSRQRRRRVREARRRGGGR